MIKVTDNFLEVDEFQFVETNFIQPEFPWFLSQVLDPNCDDLACAWEDNVQLCHLLYNAPQTSADGKESNGEYQFIVSPITSKLNSLIPLRIKANLGFKSGKIIKHGFHTDIPDRILDLKCCETAIFYLNTNNGYTEFEDGTKVESVANRLVTFPSHIKHTGTTCTDQPYRIVINFNYVGVVDGKKIDYVD